MKNSLEQYLKKKHLLAGYESLPLIISMFLCISCKEILGDYRPFACSLYISHLGGPTYNNIYTS